MRNAPEAAKREVARGRRAVMLSGDDVVDLEGRVADILRQLAVLATDPGPLPNQPQKRFINCGHSRSEYVAWPWC